ncbi:MAG: allophanate hydrolase subunit 1 [Actinobacteria bacterium]|nr:allophanate hydrolase subunit 1 [Actinomycetota bacterium]
MSAGPRVLPSGPQAFLVEYDSLDDVMRVMADLRAAPPDGVVDLVPGARTIMVHAPGADWPAIIARLRHVATDSTAIDDGPLVEIDVRYDGDDLAMVAEACSMSVDDVVAAHCSPEYRVAFCGFVPGFAYLVGLDPRLQLPRRATPRTRLAAGSVAVGGEYTGVYPVAGPGGWHVLGHTDAAMWDADRAVPALLPPGTRVRFAAR